MLDLLTQREEIQRRATEELGRRFQDYDINCVAVLIGRPESKVVDAEQGDPIERCSTSSASGAWRRSRRQTFAKQEEAAVQLKELNDAQAAAVKQTELTADAHRRRDRGRTGARRSSPRRAGWPTATWRAPKASPARRSCSAAARPRASPRWASSEAGVTLQKVRAYGDPRLFALNMVADRFASSAQPIVPERLLVMGGSTDGAGAAAGSSNVLRQLMALLSPRRPGFRSRWTRRRWRSWIARSRPPRATRRSPGNLGVWRRSPKGR